MAEGDPEDELERALTAVKALNAEVGSCGSYWLLYVLDQAKIGVLIF